MSANASSQEYPVTADQVAAYESDGVIALRSVLSQETVETMRQAIERMLEQEKKDGPKNYFKRIRKWEIEQDFRKLAVESHLPAIAAQLMQTSKVNLLYDQVFVKEPGANLPTPWHNDYPYWPVRGGQVVTLWLAFDPVTVESGGVEFIRGSHKWKARYRTFGTTLDGKVVQDQSADDDDSVEMPDFNAERDKYDIVSWKLEPGDALAFDAMLLHGAGSNTRSDVRRRAYAIRFADEAVRYYAGECHNKEIRNPSLNTGDVLDSSQYPVVFPTRAA